MKSGKLHVILELGDDEEEADKDIACVQSGLSFTKITNSRLYFKQLVLRMVLDPRLLENLQISWIDYKTQEIINEPIILGEMRFTGWPTMFTNHEFRIRQLIEAIERNTPQYTADILLLRSKYNLQQNP